MDAGKLAMDAAYVLRFKARMQERAAEAREADGKDASDLRHQAWQLRVRANLASQGVPDRKAG